MERREPTSIAKFKRAFARQKAETNAPQITAAINAEKQALLDGLENPTFKEIQKIIESAKAKTDKAIAEEEARIYSLIYPNRERPTESAQPQANADRIWDGLHRALRQELGSDGMKTALWSAVENSVLMPRSLLRTNACFDVALLAFLSSCEAADPALKKAFSEIEEAASRDWFRNALSLRKDTDRVLAIENAKRRVKPGSKIAKEFPSLTK